MQEECSRYLRSQLVFSAGADSLDCVLVLEASSAHARQTILMLKQSTYKRQQNPGKFKGLTWDSGTGKGPHKGFMENLGMMNLS